MNQYSMKNCQYFKLYIKKTKLYKIDLNSFRKFYFYNSDFENVFIPRIEKQRYFIFSKKFQKFHYKDSKKLFS